MAELKIRKGSFLIQVHDKGEVVFAIKVHGVNWNDLDEIVIEVDDTGGPHPELLVDIRKPGGGKEKEQKLNWQGVGQGYTGGAPQPPGP